MISFALILALLPATLLASPTLNKIQDILRSETSGTNTLAKASIQVQNSLPVDAYIYLYHWRGNDESTKQKLEWDWTFSGATTAGIDVKFETIRKDWDRWQAGIRFRDPSWSLWSNKFYNSLGITEINKDVPFILIQDEIIGALQGTIEESSFAIQGSDFPKNAIGINSFFFVQVHNDFNERTSVDVELLTRSDSFIQDQTFIQNKGDYSKAPLPFFFEKNATKDYVELFNFKVSRNAGRALTTKLNRCEIYPGDAGSIKTLTINSTGWSIGTAGDVRCKGKWDAPKSGVNGDVL